MFWSSCQPTKSQPARVNRVVRDVSPKCPPGCSCQAAVKNCPPGCACNRPVVYQPQQRVQQTVQQTVQSCPPGCSCSRSMVYESLASIPVKHTGYRSDLHSASYSLSKEEVARDLPPTQIKIHHVPQHLEYSHHYEKASLISEEDKLSAKQVGYQAAMHNKAYSATSEELARDLPPTQVKIHHVPTHLEYSHEYKNATQITEQDKLSAKQVGYQAAMHQKAFSATAEEVARDLPPTQVKIHHVPTHLEYSHEYKNATTITEEDKLSAKQVGYKADMHQKAFSATAEEVARDLPPTQVKVHHVPTHLEYTHEYKNATQITAQDIASAKQVGYKADMHQKAFSATAEEVARDLPPTQVKVHHMPKHLEYSHCYDHIEATLTQRCNCENCRKVVAY